MGCWLKLFPLLVIVCSLLQSLCWCLLWNSNVYVVLYIICPSLIIRDSAKTFAASKTVRYASSTYWFGPSVIWSMQITYKSKICSGAKVPGFCTDGQDACDRYCVPWCNVLVLHQLKVTTISVLWLPLSIVISFRCQVCGKLCSPGRLTETVQLPGLCISPPRGEEPYFG